MSKYGELLKQLLNRNSLNHKVTYGLRNMNQAYKNIVQPSCTSPKVPKIIHVAGTNGKGSVSWKIAKALQVSGYKTGLFISPHLCSYRERIRINFELISEHDIELTLPYILRELQEQNIESSFFEITTLLALQYFHQQEVDAIVLETGLGGRLDATNVVNPVLSVITSIGLDHTGILGDTIEKVTAEKAGIIKPNVPVVIGSNVPLELIKPFARKNNSEVIQALSSNLDDFDMENTTTAYHALKQLNISSIHNNSEIKIDLESDKLEKALECRPPCRFEVVRVDNQTIVIDAAHNVCGIKALLKKLNLTYPQAKYRFVCGFSGDTKFNDIIAEVVGFNSPHNIEFHFVQSSHPRAVPMKPLVAKNEMIHTMEGVVSVQTGIENAIEASKESIHEEVIVICGSLYIMAEVRKCLKFNEPFDLVY